MGGRGTRVKRTREERTMHSAVRTNCREREREGGTERERERDSVLVERHDYIESLLVHRLFLWSPVM